MRSAVANDRTSPATSGIGQSADRCQAGRVRRDEDPHRPDRSSAPCRASRAALRPNASGPSAQARNRSISCCRAPRGEQAVRLELQPPVIERGELRHRGLSRDDLGARRGVKQPRRERRASASGRRRTEPLEERRAAEEIQIDRVRVIGQIDAGRSVAVGQGVPVARAARQRAHVDEAQRVVPRHTLVYARMPRDEDPEHDEEQRMRRRAAAASRRGRASRPEGPRRRGTSPAAAARSASRAAPPSRCPRRDATAFSPYGTGRTGGASRRLLDAAGLVPAMFSRQ